MYTCSQDLHFASQPICNRSLWAKTTVKPYMHTLLTKHQHIHHHPPKQANIKAVHLTWCLHGYVVLLKCLTMLLVGKYYIGQTCSWCAVYVHFVLNDHVPISMWLTYWKPRTLPHEMDIDVLVPFSTLPVFSCQPLLTAQNYDTTTIVRVCLSATDVTYFWLVALSYYQTIQWHHIYWMHGYLNDSGL